MTADTGERYVETAVMLPVPGLFTYRLPAHLADAARVGMGLIVPFGPRHVTAFVMRVLDAPPESLDAVKDAQGALSAEPLFGPVQRDLFNFAARYYMAHIGEVVRTALPSGILRATRRVALITDAGREAASAEVTSKGLREWLGRLATDGEHVLHGRRAGEQPPSPALVRRAEREGWVRVESRLPLPAVKTKTVRLAEAATTMDDPRIEPALRRSPRRREVWQAVIGAGEAVPVASLAERFGASSNAALKALTQAGLVRIVERENYRLRGPVLPGRGRPTLTDDQAAAVEALNPDVAAGRDSVTLLHGVTGSGKTEVYLRLVETALAAGRGAIVLVPEIALTPQLLGLFHDRFGAVVADSHSGLSPGERYDLWRRVSRREVRVVVGARSALFAPLEGLGLIVVDEEHDGSYKQDEGVPYNARDLAVWLGKAASCPVVLGSATPSLETRHAAATGRYSLRSMLTRPLARQLPPVEIVDLRALEKDRAENRTPREKTDKLPHARVIFSDRLRDAIGRTLADGRQTILLHNRRGYSTRVFCLICGESAQCVDCDVALTYHLGRDRVVCHYCDFESEPPTVCRICGGSRMFFAGLGTEQVEHELARLFPTARVARLDRDTVTGKAGHERVLAPFRRGECDILLGTQMVAKGHDFPDVTLVGILQADTSLAMPDFRAAERTFQLVTQVAGRAGRGDAPGRIVLQTYNPDHYAIRCASTHDYATFSEMELRRREEAAYPPFTRMALIRVFGPEAGPTRQAIFRAADAARSLSQKMRLDRDAVLGPVRSPVARVKNEYRFQMLLKTPSPADLSRLAQAALKALEGAAAPRLRWRVDRDPYNVV